MHAGSQSHSMKKKAFMVAKTNITAMVQRSFINHTAIFFECFMRIEPPTEMSGAPLKGKAWDHAGTQ